jgi:chromate transporter
MSVDLAAMALVFAYLSVTSFGGGNIAIPEIHRQAVEVHRWVTERQFAEAFALSRSSPGPSTLFVFLVGAKAAGWAGAAVASLGMFVPSATIMQAACAAIRRFGNHPVLARILAGMRPITIGMVFASSYLIGRSAVTGPATAAVFVTACAVLSFTRVPILVVLLAAAAAGVACA